MVNVELAALAVRDLMAAMGVEIDDHTEGTPMRSAKAWADILRGYTEDPADHLDTTFSAPVDPGLIIVSGVRLQSMCAHHLLPFSGVATVAYRPSPGQRIVGISKLARVVTGYAARLQVQENIGYQTVDAIKRRLVPSASMCIITAAHDCMRLRGVREPGAVTTTYATDGLVLDHEHAMLRDHHMAHARDFGG
ncbi:FolE-like GTP cyclohydrolase I [Mycobacterium phage Funsized]|nr:FolE-like GTP cyclohydrolase I [Mycobacterium phage Funsized]